MDTVRPIILVIGIFLLGLGLAMLAPAALDYLLGNEEWIGFVQAAAITIFIGGALTLTARSAGSAITLQQGFLLTSLSWVAMAACAALPFIFTETGLDVTDAFFEAMSGLTTTGSTVVSGLDKMPEGILLWRAMLQWFGGIGIIVVAVAILPMLRVGGMQLFQLESSETSEKALPRITQLVVSISALYLVLSVACAIAYAFAGMSAFEAIAHAMTTIATGGFSTSDRSLGAFGPAAQYTAIAFMIIGSLPFLLYVQAIRGKWRALPRDPQVRIFFAILLSLITAMTAYVLGSAIAGGEEAFRLAAFNVTSVMTGTGYATTDYNAWGGFAVTLLFFTTFVGGCAGSTACGVKIFRINVLVVTLWAHLTQIVSPHAVSPPRYGQRPLPEDVISSVMAFFFFFALSFMMLATVLAGLGLEPITAFSASATALTNVGPGLGEIIGPAGTFEPLPDTAKWLLSAAMLLGRLELLTVLVLLNPWFWRG